MDNTINTVTPLTSSSFPRLSGGREHMADQVVSEIKYALIEANKRAVEEKNSYSVVYIDTLQTVLVVQTVFAGEEFGWDHIATVTP